MARTVSHNQLTPGSVFFVRGQVGFSRITRHTTDEERDKDNLRRMHKIDRNYTTISVYNAQVLAKDPANPTLEEIYGLESCYNSSRNAEYPGLNYTGMNKSKFLPKVGLIGEGCDPNNHPSYDEIQLSGELAKGTDVTLVLRVFTGQGNNGVALDTVLINTHDFQYYGNNNNVVSALADYGVTFNTMAPEDKRPTAEEMSASTNQYAAFTAPVNGFATNGFAAQNSTQTSVPVAEAPQTSQNPFNSFGAVPNVPANNAVPQQEIQFGVGPGRTY